MKIIVDKNNGIVFECGVIEKGLFPDVDPNTELWKVTNEKGTFYAVGEGFSEYEVSDGDIPKEYQNYTYSPEEGFVKFERPKTKEEIMEEEIRELKEQNQMLTDCILEMADIIYA